MKNVFVVILALLLTAGPALGQQLDSTKLYYTEQQVEGNVFENIITSPETYVDQDIDEDFSNIADLAFLKDVARDNKVVMLGEQHYSVAIQHLANRMFFALNTWDYFPLLLVENTYSDAEFYNYYVHLTDDALAAEFLDKALWKYLSTEEMLATLDHMRRWNKTHPAKPVSIGSTDIEHQADQVMVNLVKPYLCKIEGVDRTLIDSLIGADGVVHGDDLPGATEPWLSMAEKQKVVGDYPFVDAKFIRKVILNVVAQHNAYNLELNYYRQRAMVNKLSDDDYFGRYFRQGKVMVYGGSYHTRTKISFPDGGNFLCEGAWLNHDFEPTKGKTYSICATWMALRYGRMIERDLDDCMSYGSQYTQIANMFRTGYRNGKVDPDKYYLMHSARNHFARYSAGFFYRGELFSLPRKDWDAIMAGKEGYDKPTRNYVERLEREHVGPFDKFIVVPASDMVTLRLKKGK